jgi:hypothetical protein
MSEGQPDAPPPAATPKAAIEEATGQTRPEAKPEVALARYEPRGGFSEVVDALSADAYERRGPAARVDLLTSAIVRQQGIDLGRAREQLDVALRERDSWKDKSHEKDLEVTALKEQRIVTGWGTILVAVGGILFGAGLSDTANKAWMMVVGSALFIVGGLMQAGGRKP